MKSEKKGDNKFEIRINEELLEDFQRYATNIHNIEIKSIIIFLIWCLSNKNASEWNFSERFEVLKIT